MKLSHLQLHQSVRARFIDTTIDHGTIALVVEYTLEELGLDVVNGYVVPKARPRRKR